MPSQGQGDAVEPLNKGFAPLPTLFRTLHVACSEAVSTRCIADEFVWNTLRSEGRIEQNTVAWVYNGIVVAVHEENGRTVGGYLPLYRQRIFQLAVGLFPFVQDALSRAAMHVTLVGNRNNRIEGCNEIGLNAHLGFDA